MNLLEELKKIPKEDAELPVFLRLQSPVGNIREVSAVSSRIFKKEDGSFCQVLSVRNGDFDNDYANDFFEANGVELEEFEDGDFESLETESIDEVAKIIEALELHKNSQIEDIKYSALYSLNGEEVVLKTIQKDEYSTFGILEHCYIIEMGV